MRAHTLISLSLLLVILTSACRTPFRAYEGKSLSKSEVATVNGQPDMGLVSAMAAQQSLANAPDFILVTRIDGHDIEPHSMIELLPGSHELRIVAEGTADAAQGWGKATGDVTFTAEAGVSYRIDWTYEGKPTIWSFALLDYPSGPVVGRSVPVKQTFVRTR